MVWCGFESAHNSNTGIVLLQVIAVFSLSLLSFAVAFFQSVLIQFKYCNCAAADLCSIALLATLTNANKQSPIEQPTLISKALSSVLQFFERAKSTTSSAAKLLRASVSVIRLQRNIITCSVYCVISIPSRSPYFSTSASSIRELCICEPCIKHSVEDSAASSAFPESISYRKTYLIHYQFTINIATGYRA